MCLKPDLLESRFQCYMADLHNAATVFIHSETQDTKIIIMYIYILFGVLGQILLSTSDCIYSIIFTNVSVSIVIDYIVRKIR